MRKAIDNVWGLECQSFDRVYDEPSQISLLNSLAAETKLVFWVDEDRDQHLIFRAFDTESKLYWDTVRYEGTERSSSDLEGSFHQLRQSFPFVGYFSEGRLISWAAESVSVALASRDLVERHPGIPFFLTVPSVPTTKTKLKLVVSSGNYELKGSNELISNLSSKHDLWLWPISSKPF